MTDDEIIDLADDYADVTFDKNGRKEYEFDNHGVIAFARRLESRYSLDDTAWWFEQGVNSEREACAQVCVSMRPSKQEYDQRFYTACTLCADAIRSRRMG